MDLSIIIVSWKVKNLLRLCLQSLQNNSAGLKLEIIVIDNASADGTVEMLAAEFPAARLIINQDNRGFAAACNQGLNLANGKYILLLNPDCEVTANALAEMITYLANHPDTAIVGPQLLNADGSSQLSVRSFPTLGSQILTLLKLQNVWPGLPPLKKYLLPDFNYQAEQAVEQVMGAAMMFRRSAVDEIGLLDEKFFIWFEEVDYCLRAKQKGYRVLYLPKAKIIHHGGASFRQVMSLPKQIIFNRSLLHYFRQHGNFFSVCLIYLFLPINLVLTWLYQLVKPSNAE